MINLSDLSYALWTLEIDSPMELSRVILQLPKNAQEHIGSQKIFSLQEILNFAVYPQQIIQFISESLKKNQLLSFDLQLQDPESEAIFFVSLRGEVNSSKKLSGVAINNTATLQDFEALKKKHSLYVLATDLANLLIYDVDFFKHTIRRSPGMLALLGIPPEEEPVTFAEALAIVHPDDVIPVTEAFANIPMNKPNFCFYYRLRHSKGHYVYIRDRGRAEWENGKLRRVIGCTEDITEHKLIEENLQHAKDRAEANAHSKANFLANMSHEIRTPLNAILGFSELLKSPTDPQQSREFLDLIIKSGLHLSQVIDDILEISRVEAGEKVVNLDTFELVPTIQEVLKVMGDKAFRKGLGFNVFLDPQIPQTVISDPQRLRQILFNIIGNAVKFTQEGYIGIHAVFKREPQDHLVVTVTDTGLGIPEKDFERIFAPFSQVDFSAKRKLGGSGLGLTIARHLARALGGDLSLISSKESVGSVFEINIAVEVAQANNQSSFSAATNDVLSSNTQEKKMALVVDDQKESLLLMSKLFEKTNFNSKCTSNIKEALDLLKIHKFEVIFLDIQMPEIDGMAAFKLIRNIDATTPIIAFTAHALPGQRKEFLSHGFSSVLTKPVSRERLQNTLNSFSSLN